MLDRPQRIQNSRKVDLSPKNCKIASGNRINLDKNLKENKNNHKMY